MDMTDYAGDGAKFIGIADVQAGPFVASIVSVTLSTKFDRPVLEFDDERRLTLNATNVRTLLRVFGPSSDGWIGKRVQVYAGTVINQSGKEQPGVRVRAADNGSPLEPIPPTRADAEPLDDAIPF